MRKDVKVRGESVKKYPDVPEETGNDEKGSSILM